MIPLFPYHETDASYKTIDITSRRYKTHIPRIGKNRSRYQNMKTSFRDVSTQSQTFNASILKMKKIILIIIIALLFFPWDSQASFYANRMYCTIQSDIIQISLQRKDNYLCIEYIAYINKIMRDLAQDLVVIQ